MNVVCNISAKFARIVRNVMTDAKKIERIINLIENMNYKKAYIEIETKDNKFIIEKNQRSEIGFRCDINEH